MITVYIASPYTAGDQAANVRAQMDAADELMTLGYCPVAPLLSHFVEIVHPRPYRDWMRVDMEILSRCDVLLRLPGESDGADEEVEHACNIGKPVMYDISQINMWARPF